MADRLNKLIYLPSPGNLAINAVYFTVVFILVICLRYASDEVQKLSALLAATDASLGETVVILLVALVGVATAIFAKTWKYFICTRQCLRATIGTAVLVTILSAGIWCLVQVFAGSQQLVVLRPYSWSLQGTLNNLKYGAMLALLSSSLSFVGGVLGALRPEYDFTDFNSQWERWKSPVEKLRQGKKLTEQEHKQLLDATKEMRTKLDSLEGHVQPVSLASAAALREPLRRFDIWYQNQTALSYAEVSRLDDNILPHVNQILRRC